MTEDNDYLTLDQLIGSNIRDLRNDARLSLDEAAILMTIWHGEPWSYERLRKREIGQQPVTVAELHAFADVFGVTLLRFLRPARGVRFIGANQKLVRAEDYHMDYLWDPGGRTGEPGRIDPKTRSTRTQRSIYMASLRAKEANREGKPIPPDLLDNTTPKEDLKTLAARLRPLADDIKQPARKGHSDGADQED